MACPLFCCDKEGNHQVALYKLPSAQLFLHKYQKLFDNQLFLLIQRPAFQCLILIKFQAHLERSNLLIEQRPKNGISTTKSAP